MLIWQRVLSFALVAVVAISTITAFSRSAAAVSASDWKAGNIIGDAVFTDKSSMNVGQIQTWLDRRLQDCDYHGTQASEFGGTDYDGDGVVTRAEYGRMRGNPAPFTCLNNYYEVPKTSPGPTIPASSYGQAARPSGSKSAAQLIYDAAQAYNISPRVLLVKLGTESAGPLTSDTWPFKNQYLYAMGAHCPDSGPGGSANCDSNYAGFSLQMREAAKLLRWYLDNMTKSWWAYKKPYATNYILWNVVERGCGGSNVYIQNKATAALYTYTPYQPNAAALANVYGTGDNCSAYGNRNFWRVFSDWFGSTHYTTRGAIGAKFNAFGGNSGILGEPQMNEWCALTQGGCYQRFESGSIYWTSNTGAWVVRGGIRTTWGSYDSINGPFRYPTADEQSIAGGTRQLFQGGDIYWSSGNGAHGVRGGVKNRYVTLSGTASYLGFPTSSEIIANNGVFQRFEGGNIYWSSDTGAWNTRGAIQSRYLVLQGTRSILGFPIADESTVSGGSYQPFQKGSIYWSAATGTHQIYGAINSRYQALGGASGNLGFPTSAETGGANSSYQSFENGAIYWSPKTGAWPISNSMQSHYSAFGGNSGQLGHPIGSEKETSDGLYQSFENGAIYIKTGEDAQIVRGAIKSRYLKLGGSSSTLGYPTSGEIAVPGGVYQQYEDGRIYWSAETGARAVTGDVLLQYSSVGGESGILGYPQGPVKPAYDGNYQAFQRGRIYSSIGSGAHIIRGGILGKYLSSLTDAERLGLPTSNESSNQLGEVSQSFEGGSISWKDGRSTIEYH